MVFVLTQRQQFLCSAILFLQLQLQEQIKELERALGQKQIKIDFLEKQIEIAEETYQVDIKKKLNSKRSTGTGSTGKNTDTK